ncbi:MAG: hypothetical protein LAN64_00280 [Acidobacteriia bacterium]|nr:hypothetical protein [Terriglobia bacterium]
MAYKTLVADTFTTRLWDALRSIEEDKGPYFLVMVVPSESGLSQKWNLVVSAPWMDQEGVRNSVIRVSSALKQGLKSMANRIERISVMPGGDPFVREMALLNISGGPPTRIESLALMSRGFEDAIVFVAKRPPDLHQQARPTVRNQR